MNKKSVILIAAVLVILFSSLLIYKVSNASYAQETSNQPKIVLECTKTAVNPDETITCYIKGEDFDYGVSAFGTTVILGDNLVSPEYSFNNSNWQGAVNNGVIDLYTDVNKTGNFELASFTVKADNVSDGFDTSISLSNTFVSNASFEEQQITTDELSIRIKSNVNTLSNLTVSSSSIVYNPDIKEYSDTIDEDNVVISATRTDQNSVLSGDIGNKSLKYGRNQFVITVTSESGLVNEYIIIINRPDKFTLSDKVDVREIEDIKYFYNVTLESKVTDITNEITTSGQINITDNSNNILSNDSTVGTGNKVSIILSNETIEYTVIVLGDTNGDGKITVTDVSKMFQHYRKTNIIPATKNHFILAGDVKHDDEIKLTDVAKLFQYVRGQISSLD